VDFITGQERALKIPPLLFEERESTGVPDPYRSNNWQQALVDYHLIGIFTIF
jgi:hypothetical protein